MVIAEINSDADRPSTISIAITDEIVPKSAVYLLKYLKDGLKFGAEDILSKSMPDS